MPKNSRDPLTRAVAAALLLSLPGAAAAAASEPPVPGAQPVAGLGWAVPVSTAAPAWYDQALHDNVVAAGAQGVALPAGASFTASSGVEPQQVGLGPGTWLLSLKGTSFTWCTANFVFRNGSTYGLGTAGHCKGIDDLNNGVVTAFAVPPPEVCLTTGICAPGLYAIGQFVGATVRDNGVGDDFALVQLFSAFNAWVRPNMPVWGGPTGAYGESLVSVNPPDPSVGPATLLTPSMAPAVLGHCGYGLAVGTGGTCRASMGLFAAGTAFAWYGAAAPGDSGSGAVLVGHVDTADLTNVVPALANLTHIIILDANIKRKITIGPFFTGMVAGTTIAKIQSILGSNWQLVSGALP